MPAYSLIIAPVLVALAALFVALGAVLLRNTYPAGGRAAGLAMLAVAVWLFGAAGENLTVDSVALFPLVRAMKYVGVAMVGPLYLVFVLQFALGIRLSRGAMAALLLVPALTTLLVWTNPLHELMWESPYPPLGRGVWGPWFKGIHTPYSYATVLAATAGLFLEMVRGSTLRRAQSSLLLVGTLVPLMVNALYLANPELPDLSQTPLAFSVTAAVFAWGFFRLRLFQVSPLALRAAFDAVLDAIIVVDRERRIADLNPSARTLLDPSGSDDPIGQPVQRVLARTGIEAVELEEMTRSDIAIPDGRRLETDIRGIRDPRDAGVRGWIVVLRDVTDQRRAEAALRESEAMMRSVLERSPIGILRLSPLRNDAGRIRDFTTVLANPTAQETLVPAGQALVGRTLTDVRPPHTPLLMDMLRRVLRTGDPEETVVQVDTPGDSPRWLRLNAVALGSDVSLSFVDITEERTRHAEMVTAAHTDPLTALLNRRGLEKDAGQLIESARSEERSLALLYVDLDDFKEVNDSHGHEAGDTALREFARRLQTCLRAEDVLARVGGDEFVILLQEPAPGTAEEVTRRIREACRPPMLVEDAEDGRIYEVRLGCAVGSARLPQDGRDLQGLMRAADSSMYRAKDGGRVVSGD